MVLVDTSVWIEHLRRGQSDLISLLEQSAVYSHPFIVGELACGNLRNRQEILRLMSDLPRVQSATDSEVLFFIEEHQIMGKGIGYIDAHLLASVCISKPVTLWTGDKRLYSIAEQLGVAASMS